MWGWDVNTMLNNKYYSCWNCREGWTTVRAGGVTLWRNPRAKLQGRTCPHCGQSHHLSDWRAKVLLKIKHGQGCNQSPHIFLCDTRQILALFFFFWQKRLWNYVLCCLWVFTHCLSDSQQTKHACIFFWVGVCSTASLYFLASEKTKSILVFLFLFFLFFFGIILGLC